MSEDQVIFWGDDREPMFIQLVNMQNLPDCDGVVFCGENINLEDCKVWNTRLERLRKFVNAWAEHGRNYKVSKDDIEFGREWAGAISFEMTPVLEQRVRPCDISFKAQQVTNKRPGSPEHSFSMAWYEIFCGIREAQLREKVKEKKGQKSGKTRWAPRVCKKCKRFFVVNFPFSCLDALNRVEEAILENSSEKLRDAEKRIKSYIFSFR